MSPFRSLTTAVALLLSAAFAAPGCEAFEGPSCGDGSCGNGEGPYTCPSDCGSPPSAPFQDPDPGSPDPIEDPGTGPGPSPGPTTGSFCGNRLAPSTEGALLPIGPIGQQCPQWCWAAVISMIASAYGTVAAQCELASAKAGFNAPSCCNYAACAYPICDQPAPTFQMEQVLGSLLGIHGTSVQGKISESELRSEIANGRPVIVGYLNSFAGHVVLVTGFGPGPAGSAPYHVVDPYYGVFDIPYAQLAYGYMGGGTSWTWGYTAYRLSPYANGCNFAWDPGCGCK